MTEDTLKRLMDRAVERYSRLFKLPPSPRVLSLLALLCIGGCSFSVLIISPSLQGLTEGLLLGLSLLIISLAADYVVKKLVLKADTIFDFRRTIALSFFGWVFWFCFIFLGAAVAKITDLSWWIRMCLLGFSAATILRLLVMSAISSLSNKRVLVASYLQPFACVFPFLLLWISKGYTIDYYMPLFFLLSSIISLISVSIFLSLLNRLGRSLGVHSLALFKAFMLNWVLDFNTPFEDLLEKLGEERDVEISLLRFNSRNAKSVIVVPSVHPGPFKNIGSSPLPALLKSALQKELSCIACVPHGLLGHEFDLASQRQNQKVIDRAVAEASSLRDFESLASSFVKVNNGVATACCQIFGKSAFISFTLAPKTIEDLPQEVGVLARQEAEKQGLTLCAVVNAHNSIDSNPEEECLLSLKSVATECLETAASSDLASFRVGAASAVPKEFSLEDGMGPGGITVVVVSSGKQKAAYVVIDGNNMVSGLRERILSSLYSIGIDDGEVFTTDTHSVSALILTGHGYHPLGEAIDNEKLIAYITDVTKNAIDNMDVAGAACRTITVPCVKVIGAKKLEALCVLIDRSAKRAKRIVGPIFTVSGLLLMLFLLLV